MKTTTMKTHLVPAAIGAALAIAGTLFFTSREPAPDPLAAKFDAIAEDIAAEVEVSPGDLRRHAAAAAEAACTGGDPNTGLIVATAADIADGRADAADADARKEAANKLALTLRRAARQIRDK